MRNRDLRPWREGALCSRPVLGAGGRPYGLPSVVGHQLARGHDLVEQCLGDIGEERQRPQDLQDAMMLSRYPTLLDNLTSTPKS